MRFIILLRGVNVSGKNKLPMAELRSSLENAGFDQVKTYIQSGNIALNSTLKDIEVEQIISDLLKKEFDIDVPIHLIPQDNLAGIFEKNPFTGESAEQRFIHFTLLKNPPGKEQSDLFMATDFEGEHKHYSKECVFLFLPKGYGRAKLNNAFIERKLDVSATTRNYKTFTKLMEL